MRSLNWFRGVRGGLAALLVAQGILSCGGSDNHPTARVWKGTAARNGIVSGFVLDDETGAPIANATVTVGGVPTRSHVDGAFEAAATAGRAHVLVTGDDLLETSRDVAVGDQPLPMNYRVAHRAGAQVVGP